MDADHPENGVLIPRRSTPDIDSVSLLPRSLGLNRAWTVFKAQRRVAGGEPINFYRGPAQRAISDAYSATQAILDRQYRRDALDGLRLDEDEDAAGAWATISEYASAKGIGPRKARDIMEGLGILQSEIEVRMVPSAVDPSHSRPDYRSTARLAQWAVQAGLGKRIQSKSGVAFDILSPAGVEWLNARWPAPNQKPQPRRGRPVSRLREEVRALMDEGKSQADIVRLLGKSKQAVHHHMRALREAA